MAYYGNVSTIYFKEEFTMKNEHLLHTEIESEMSELAKLAVGSDAYKVAVDGITKLMDRAIEIDRLNAEYTEKEVARIEENNLKAQELEMEKKDRFVKHLLTGLGIATTTGVTIWGTLKSLRFEIDGTVTTMAGRNFISRLFKGK